mmetsp:Transcript_5033/g.7564  ORF Transcript_5033/g.7564 Transcript_5033/m.7564 type:complete len:110 (-) Transcript_5033:849-1178(-)
MNVLLLIEQCSLVLYLGGLSKDTENILFGLNLILILVFQERDSTTGEIKYSVIPLAMNNTFLFLSNCRSLAAKDGVKKEHPAQKRRDQFSSSSPSSDPNSIDDKVPVNK